MKALVLHARKYSFTGRDGKAVEGNSISYLEYFDPYDLDDEKGIPPYTVVAEDSCLGDLLSAPLPAVCDIRVARRPGRGGKPESVITACKMVKSWKLEDTLGVAATATK